MLYNDKKDRIAVLGAIVLVASLLCIDDSIPYPGWMAALPVTGTMCLIFAEPNNPVSKWIFANPVTVFIGKISYPFYLSHWIFISVTFIINGGFEDITFNERLLLINTSFISAIFIYYFIEKPIRYNLIYYNIKIYILLFNMILLCLSGLIIYNNYFKLLSYDNTNKIQEDMDLHVFSLQLVCHEKLKKLTDVKKDYMCLSSNFDFDHNVAIVGDSYAEHLIPGMLKNSNYKLISFTHSASIPYIKDTKEYDETNEFYKKIYNYIINDPNIHTIIISCHPRAFYENIITIDNIQNERLKLKKSIQSTLDILLKHGKKIIIVLEDPELPFNPERCINRKLPSFIKPKNICKFDRKVHDENIYRNFYKDIVYEIYNQVGNIKLFDMTDLFCDKQYCYLEKDGRLLYRDRGHLNIYGSIYVSEDLSSLINQQ